VAIVRDPLHSVAATGSIGSQTYCRRGARTYARPSGGSPYVATPDRLVQTALMTYLAHEWQALNPGEHNEWREYAALHPLTSKLGVNYWLSGYNWWVRRSVLSHPLTGHTAVDAFGSPPWASLTGLLLTPADPGWCDWEATPAITQPTDTRADVWVQGPYPPSRRSLIRKARRLITYEFNYIDGELNFGASGHYALWIRWIQTMTGKTSPWLTNTVDVI